jgi:hypothetical protein
MNASNPHVAPVLEYHVHQPVNTTPSFLDAAQRVRATEALGEDYPDTDAYADFGLQGEADDDDMWLARRCRGAHAVCVVHCLASKPTITLTVPISCSSTRSIGHDALRDLYPTRYAGTMSPFALVQIRSVVTRDGARWVSWCTSPECEDFRSANVLLGATFFEGVSRDFSLSSLAGICAGDSVCPCGLAGLQALYPTAAPSEWLEAVSCRDDEGAVLLPLCANDVHMS